MIIFLHRALRAALALCLVFLLSATRWNLVAGAIGLAIGLLIYALRRRPDPANAVPPVG